jgi:hypothetical protein
LTTNDSKDQGREATIEAMARAMNIATDGHDRYWTGYMKSAEAAYSAALATSASALARDEASVALTGDARECLMDVVSHHDNIVEGFCAQRKKAWDVNDNDSAMYWDREMAVACRMKEQAERALLAASSAATVSDEASVQADAPVGWQFRDRVEGEWTKWRHANTAIRERYKDCPNTQFRPVFLATYQAATTAVAQDERAAFEAWMKNRFPHSDTTGFASVMWLAWQARAVSSAPPLTSDSDGWQPIETAPRGAKGYCWMNLAWGPEGDLSTGVGMRWGDRFFAAASFYCLGREKKYEFREVEVRPSYWMPLLSAPAQSTNGEQS